MILNKFSVEISFALPVTELILQTIHCFGVSIKFPKKKSSFVVKIRSYSKWNVTFWIRNGIWSRYFGSSWYLEQHSNIALALFGRQKLFLLFAFLCLVQWKEIRCSGAEQKLVNDWMEIPLSRSRATICSNKPTGGQRQSSYSSPEMYWDDLNSQQLTQHEAKFLLLMLWGPKILHSKSLNQIAVVANKFSKEK